MVTLVDDNLDRVTLPNLIKLYNHSSLDEFKTEKIIVKTIRHKKFNSPNNRTLIITIRRKLENCTHLILYYRCKRKEYNSQVRKRGINQINRQIVKYKFLYSKSKPPKKRMNYKR